MVNTKLKNLLVFVLYNINRYGVLKFIEIKSPVIKIQWWLGNIGVTDFSNAPEQTNNVNTLVKC